MKWKSVTIAVMAMLITTLIVGCTTEETVTTANAASVIYQMWEKCGHLLAESPESLNEQRWVEFREWLGNLDFKKLPEPERGDLERCRRVFIDFLDNPPSAGFSWSFSQTSLSHEFCSLFVDFEINGKRAIQDGQMEELAQDIDGFLGLEKFIFLNASDIDTELLGQARPKVKFFVEYLLIDMTMVMARERSLYLVSAQTALLAMDPDSLEDIVARREFTDLHQDSLLLSRSLTRGHKDQQKASRCIVKLIEIAGKLDVTDQEIRDIGNEGLVELIEIMRQRYDQ